MTWIEVTQLVKKKKKKQGQKRLQGSIVQRGENF